MTIHFFYIFCTVIVFRFWEDSGIKEKGGLFLSQGTSFDLLELYAIKTWIKP